MGLSLDVVSTSYLKTKFQGRWLHLVGRFQKCGSLKSDRITGLYRVKIRREEGKCFFFVANIRTAWGKFSVVFLPSGSIPKVRFLEVGPDHILMKRQNKM